MRQNHFVTNMSLHLNFIWKMLRFGPCYWGYRQGQQGKTHKTQHGREKRFDLHGAGAQRLVLRLSLNSIQEAKIEVPWGSHNWGVWVCWVDWIADDLRDTRRKAMFFSLRQPINLSCSSRLRYGSMLSYCFFKTGHFGGHHSTDTSTLPKCSCQWWMVCFAQGMSQFDKKDGDLKTAEIYAHQFHRLAMAI